MRFLTHYSIFAIGPTIALVKHVLILKFFLSLSMISLFTTRSMFFPVSVGGSYLVSASLLMDRLMHFVLSTKRPCHKDPGARLTWQFIFPHDLQICPVPQLKYSNTFPKPVQCGGGLTGQNFVPILRLDITKEGYIFSTIPNLLGGNEEQLTL